MCVSCRGAEDRAERGREEAGGLREYCYRCRVDLPVEGESRACARSFGSDKNYSAAFAGLGERSESAAQLRCAGVHRVAGRSGVARIPEVGRRQRPLILWSPAALFILSSEGPPLSRPQPSLKRKLDVQKRLVEVGDDVFDVFDTDGKANQTLRDPYALADFDGHGCVSHQSRERN